MDYKIAIPSYKRSDNFIVKSLLEKANLNPEVVYIFVSDENEKKLYEDAFPEYKIIYEKPLNNLMEKHNFIVDYFNDGDLVVVIEDDIQEIVKKKGGRTIPFTQLDNLFKIGFVECHKTSSKLWGISPTNNGFFMTNRCEKGFRIITGYMFGMIIDKRIRVSTSNKHDYERTILHQIHFGGSVRFCGFGQESKSFTNKGGLQEFSKDERMKQELETNKYLIAKYPRYIAAQTRTNKTFNELTEVRLLRK